MVYQVFHNNKDTSVNSVIIKDCFENVLKMEHQI